MPDVVVGALLGVPGLHRQGLLGPVQRLNLAFLIHTQHDRVLRWRQVQADHIGDLGLQLGVGGELERLGLPRFHPVPLPGLGDGDMAGAQPLGQQPRRPMRDPQTGRWRTQRLRHDPTLVDRAPPAGPFLIGQSRQAVLDIAGPPHVHRGPAHPDQPGDLHVRRAIGGQQHDPRPSRQPRSHRTGPGQPNQRITLVLPQQQGFSGRSSHTPVSHACVKLIA